MLVKNQIYSKNFLDFFFSSFCLIKLSRFFMIDSINAPPLIYLPYMIYWSLRFFSGYSVKKSYLIWFKSVWLANCWKVSYRFVLKSSFTRFKVDFSYLLSACDYISFNFTCWEVLRARDIISKGRWSTGLM